MPDSLHGINSILMSGLGGGGCFRPAESCPVASTWADGNYMSHQGGDEPGSFVVADAWTRDGKAAVRVAVWRCVHCGTLLAGIGRVDEELSPEQAFTWVEEV